jgi:hypothetical protein
MLILLSLGTQGVYQMNVHVIKIVSVTEISCIHISSLSATGKWKGWDRGNKVNNINNSVILIRKYFIEIVTLPVLTPSTVESAYKLVSEICCCYLQGGREWCVLWWVYVGMRIASETHVICRPWRWRLYIPPKCLCPSTWAAVSGVYGVHEAT